MAKLSFSIITPAYNNADKVKKLLDSVSRQALEDSALEVIVVDDCSKDYSLKQAVEESGFAKYIRLEKNGGPSLARNIGAKSAKNDVLIFVDSDVLFNDDTLLKVRDRFERDESVEVFGGEYDIVPANPSLATKFKAIMGRSWCPREGVTTVFLARFGAIKKRVFEELGGFDTKLNTADVEDYELGRRIMEKGHIIHYDPTVTVKHHFPAFRKQVRLFFQRSFMWVYILKKYGKFDNICTTPFLGLAQIFGFASICFFIISLIKGVFVYPALLLLAAFTLMNLRLFKLTLKTEGLVFTAASIVMALIIACSIVLGAFCGVANFFICGKEPCGSPTRN